MGEGVEFDKEYWTYISMTPQADIYLHKLSRLYCVVVIGYGPQVRAVTVGIAVNPNIQCGLDGKDRPLTAFSYIVIDYYPIPGNLPYEMSLGVILHDVMNNKKIGPALIRK